MVSTRDVISFPVICLLFSASHSAQFRRDIFPTVLERIVRSWAGQETTETLSVSPRQLRERRMGMGIDLWIAGEKVYENMRTTGSFD